MQTASFGSVLETILFIVLFYYAFKFAMRLLLPVALKKVVEKAEENLRNHSQQASYNTSNPGQSYSQAPQSDKPRETKKVGEYIDFEEIE